MIDAYQELVAAKAARPVVEVVVAWVPRAAVPRTGGIGRRPESRLEDAQRNRIDVGERYLIVGIRVADEHRTPGAGIDDQSRRAWIIDLVPEDGAAEEVGPDGRSQNGREISRHEGGVGHRAAADAAAHLACPLVIAEEERAVADERPSENPAELVAIERRRPEMAFLVDEVGIPIEEVARLERVVAVELIKVPVQLVAAGRGHHADLTTGPAAKLCRVAAHLDLEFLNRIHRRPE